MLGGVRGDRVVTCTWRVATAEYVCGPLRPTCQWVHQLVGGVAQTLGGLCASLRISECGEGRTRAPGNDKSASANQPIQRDCDTKQQGHDPIHNAVH